MRSNLFYKILLSSLFFLLSSLYITYPLIFHLGDYVTGFGDELVIAWIQNWVIHALLTNPLSLFQTNIYFPFVNTLAFSETFISTALISAIPVGIVKDPIASTNFTFISSLALLGFSIWALSFYLTRNFWSSLLSGLIVIFSPAVLDKKVHLQVLSVYFVPFAMILYIHFFKTKKYLYFFLFLLTLLLQIYNSFLPGYFLIFFCLVYTIWLKLQHKVNLKLFLSKNILFGISFFFILIVPILIPYFQVAKDYGAKRDMRDSIHFALQPEDYFYPGEHTRLSVTLKAMSDQMHYQENASLKPGFLGLLFSFLVIAAVIVYAHSKKKLKNIESPFIMTALVGFVLSLGPFLHLGRVTIHYPLPIPLPYALLYFIAPGFQGFRNSARWEMLFILCIAVVISLFLAKILKKTSKLKQFVVYAICFLLIIWEFPYPMKFSPIPSIKNFPAIHKYLANLPEKEPVIFIPISSWNMAHPNEEMLREYFSTLHFTPMMNGYSGFTPPDWQTTVEKINKDFPSNKTLSIIRKNNVKTLILDKTLIDADHMKDNERPNANEMIKILDNNKDLTYIETINNYIVYKYKK